MHSSGAVKRRLTVHNGRCFNIETQISHDATREIELQRGNYNRIYKRIPLTIISESTKSEYISNI